MTSTREKLIEWLGDLNCNAEYCKDCEFSRDLYGCVRRQKEIIVDRLIANGLTFVTDNNVGDKMTPTAKDINVPIKWIPVEEGLPEIPDDWTEHPDPVLYMMKTTKTIYAGYYGENGTYRDRYFRQYHDRYEGVDADDVLCWMWQHDLPEPPKGE